MTKSVQCPYCQSEAVLRDSTAVYDRSYGNVWICSRYPECDAYVGCHGSGSTPKGTMANAELRDLRIRCHGKFDRLWKSKRMTRKEAYRNLQAVMDMTKEQAHIAKFGVEDCKKLLYILRPHNEILQEVYNHKAT